MSQKDELSPHQQRRGFARAFDTVQSYLEIGNLIGAYVIAFSILEDRITKMFDSCTAKDVGKVGKSGKKKWLNRNSGAC